MTKKIFLTSFITLLFFSAALAVPKTNSLSKNTHIQTNTPAGELISPPDGDEYVYWFFVRIRIDQRKKQYRLVGTGSRIKSGKISEYDRMLWWGTTKGQIAIGPFRSYDEARASRMLYRKNPNQINEFSEEEQNREVSWFLVSFKPRKRSRSYQMQRMPARVASGTNVEFVDAMFEGFTFQHLAIGPFWDYYQAEKAKEMFRRNE